MSIPQPQEVGLLSSYFGLLCLSVAIIYTGAWSSLPSPKVSQVRNSPFEDEEEDDEDIVERLSTIDAYLFPIFGSIVLGGFYLIFKYFGKEWINRILTIYFSFMGVGSVWKTAISACRFVVGEHQWKSFDKIKLLALKRTRELSSFSMRTPSVFLLVPSAMPSILYSWMRPKPALLTNILAISFAHNALSLLKLDSFGTGVALLGGLFIYDIWWVFGTKVMVTVATGLDVPIKLLWPKSIVFSNAFGFTMLGLGDIVVPGIFISLTLRYDLSRSSSPNHSTKFRKPYFTAALTSYALGLIATMSVMHSFKAAQPALLYLSPACILSLLLTAIREKELTSIWSWRDEPSRAASPSHQLQILHPKLEDDNLDNHDNTQSLSSLQSSKIGEDFVNVEADIVQEGEAKEKTDVARKRKNKRRN